MVKVTKVVSAFGANQVEALENLGKKLNTPGSALEGVTFTEGASQRELDAFRKKYIQNISDEDISGILRIEKTIGKFSCIYKDNVEKIRIKNFEDEKELKFFVHEYFYKEVQGCRYSLLFCTVGGKAVEDYRKTMREELQKKLKISKEIAIEILSDDRYEYIFNKNVIVSYAVDPVVFNDEPEEDDDDGCDTKLTIEAFKSEKQLLKYLNRNFDAKLYYKVLVAGQLKQIDYQITLK